MEGLHILAEFQQCQAGQELMCSAEALERLCLSACQEAGLTVVGKLFLPFGTPQAPLGATGAVILAESHLALHTWPERQAVTFDLYVCNFSRDNRAAAESVYAHMLCAFHPQAPHRRDIWRGEVA
ncbi:MAG: S-adenosylmethionine decarboxylase [Betaproteobacteria bacterium]|nr:S-adenosylmethionine decarboxylase [Betaproteobacteria bacterium]